MYIRGSDERAKGWEGEEGTMKEENVMSAQVVGNSQPHHLENVVVVNFLVEGTDAIIIATHRETGHHGNKFFISTSVVPVKRRSP